MKPHFPNESLWFNIGHDCKIITDIQELVLTVIVGIQKLDSLSFILLAWDIYVDGFFCFAW